MLYFQATLYASMKANDLEWKRLNAEIDEEDDPDKDVPDTDLLEWLLLREAGWTKDIGAFHPVVVNALANLKAELMHEHPVVPATVEKVVD